MGILVNGTGMVTKPLTADRYAEIIPLTFGRFRIIVTDGSSVFNNW